MTKKIKVMISSRNRDAITFEGVTQELSVVRQKIKKDIESQKLFGEKVFEVWINEAGLPSPGDEDWWDHCLRKVDEADILLVLNNGHAGYADEGNQIGICHAELQKAYNSAPGKIRIVSITHQVANGHGETAIHQRFQEYIKQINPFSRSLRTGEEIISHSKNAILDTVLELVTLGRLEAHKGRFHSGHALEWSRLDFFGRKNIMESTMASYLKGLNEAFEHDDEIFWRQNDTEIHFRCHAIPAPLTVSAAREMIGQPFLDDHEFSALQLPNYAGPVHVVACHRNITESQALKIIGFPDVTVVNPPFGIYVADNIHKTQILFIKECRDETTTRHGLQRAFNWLEHSGELHMLCQRAKARRRILQAISLER